MSYLAYVSRIPGISLLERALVFHSAVKPMEITPRNISDIGKYHVEYKLFFLKDP
jgi:hypothetical protein